jgi:hypothetical protein
VKVVHLKYAGKLNPLPTPSWKWDDISMDFIVGLPKMSKGFDSIWVIVDRLTKIAHLLPVKVLYPATTYAKLYFDRILSLHGVPKTIISDRVPSLYPNCRSYTNHWALNLFIVQLIILRSEGRWKESIRL